MNVLKRTTAFLLAVFSSLSLFSCATYKPALNSGSDNSQSGAIEQPELDDDPTNDFTVSLRLDGNPYVPNVAMNVYWRNAYDIYIAPFGEDGVARIDGLDSDYDATYTVSLSNVPYGYAYDPNAYQVTNVARNTVIDLYTLNTVNGSGLNLNNCYYMQSTGVYSITIRRPGQNVFFEFAPQTSGTYSIESWVDINDDGISPIATGYYGSSSYKHSPYRVTKEGACGSYTRNFIHEVEIASQMISSSGGGSQTFTFAVTAEPKNGVYPVSIAFAVKRNGDFDLNTNTKTYVQPQADFSHFDFDAFNNLAGGTIVGAETLYPGTANSYMFDEDNYKIWQINEGGDGVYHVYDPVKYPSTKGYGPILVAFITKPCRFLNVSFTEIESMGNNALTVNGTENYKQFIEGWEAVASAGYYCTFNCKCHPASDPYKACAPGCKSCTPHCTPCPEYMMHKPGYAALCNADGVAPVTKELAEFFQKYAITQRYFADGDGWVEKNKKVPIDAYEDSQWLFPCGYYV